MATVGVLALQGDVREHIVAVERVGARAVPVRRPEDLHEVDRLILPGGESTAIGRLADLYGLIPPLRQALESGMPALGTCAGMILLASGVTAGSQPQLGVLDVVVERNAFGPQVESFETDVAVTGFGEPFPAVFIRAPWVAKVGGQVDVLAEVRSHPVMVRQGDLLATSFHPELTNDDRIHRMLLEI